MSTTRIADLDLALIKTILELRSLGISHRKIAARVGLSHGSVMRIVEWQATGETPRRAQTQIPKRTRNGHAALPDFARIARLEAEGQALKDIWQAYALSRPNPYSYPYFCTLYRVWLEEAAERDTQSGNASPPEHPRLPLSSKEAASDYTADEEHRAEMYWRRKADPRSSVQVLSGHDCSVRVKNGELVCYDTGIVRSFEKAVHRLGALVFLGTAGQITVDAVKWCAAQGVSIYIIGWHGELISVLNTALLPSDKIGDSSTLTLRRAQFRADPLSVAKAILMEKTASQHRYAKLSAVTRTAVTKQITSATSLTKVLTIEAQAAVDYWENQCLTLRHKKRNWPPAWTQFTHRVSAISGRPRHATHPVNAILNYAYSIVAAQLTRSLAAHGLDPACGFLHADAPGRHSLAYDMMELLRADIDASMFAWIKAQTWKRPDFPVTPEGVVRLQATLAAVVAQQAALPQRDIDHAISWLIDLLMRGVGGNRTRRASRRKLTSLGSR